MDFLKSIIDQYEEVDTNEEITELFNQIKDKNNSLNDINLEDMANCSFPSRIEGLPVPTGTNFFSLYDPLQSVNTIIPDLFKHCAVKNHDKFNVPVLSTRIFPKIKVKIPNEPGASIVTRLQKMLPEEVIKSFFYFGYKSNFELMEFKDIIFLEIKVKEIINSESVNLSNYTNPETIFNSIYNKDTILRSILDMNDLLESVKDEKADSTNIGNFTPNYLISSYAIIYLPDDFNINKGDYFKINNINDKTTTSISYSDLVYLNYLKKLVSNPLAFQNFLLLLENDQLGTNVEQGIIDNFTTNLNFISNNNIFKIINMALEVKSYIISVISSQINNKNYKRESYTSNDMVSITKTLYCNYAKNESFNFPEYTPPNWCY